METVGIYKVPAEPLGQKDPDGRLPRAGNAHHHHDHRSAPGDPAGWYMLKSFTTDGEIWGTYTAGTGRRPAVLSQPLKDSCESDGDFSAITLHANHAHSGCIVSRWG